MGEILFIIYIIISLIIILTILIGSIIQAIILYSKIKKSNIERGEKNG